MRVYNERSGVEFDAWFETNPGEPTIPTSVHYRLRCATNDETLVDWTSVAYEIESAESGVTGVKAHITIPGSAQRLVNSANRREVRELQVVADKDTAGEFSEIHQYYLARMGGRS